jgi:hypothetical protein
MKLPRLSDPTVIKVDEFTTITSASHFDLMSTGGEIDDYFELCCICNKPGKLFFTHGDEWVHLGECTKIYNKSGIKHI